MLLLVHPLAIHQWWSVSYVFVSGAVALVQGWEICPCGIGTGPDLHPSCTFPLAMVLISAVI